MRFVIQNLTNKGYYKVPTQGWTTHKLCTMFPDIDSALKQKDALERKEKYYEKIKVIPEEEIPENMRY